MSDRATWRQAGLGFCVAFCIVMSAEWLFRTDCSPASLPFESTRTGTLVDVLCADDRPKEILFAGSSQCAYNIDPYVFADEWGRRCGVTVSALNVGIPGANVVTLAALYKRVPQAYRSRLLIFVVSPLGMDGFENRNITEAYGADYLDGSLGAVEGMLMELKLFRYRRQYRDLRYQFYVWETGSLKGDLDRRLGPHGMGWYPGQGGFLRMNLVDDRLGALRGRVSWPQVSRAALAALGDVIREARGLGSEVLLLIPPHPPRLNDVVPDADEKWGEFRVALANLAAEGQVRVIDHSCLDRFDNDAFFDFTHLRNEMVPAYSHLLADAVLDGEIPQFGYLGDPSVDRTFSRATHRGY